MSNGKRTVIEIGAVVVLLMVFIGSFAGYAMWNRQRVDRALAASAEAQRQEAEAVRAESEAWTGALVEAEAAAVARAFAAGIHPMVVTERRDSLQASVGALVHLPGVNFVHVLKPDGRILASSDDVARTRGQTDERGAWAAGAHDLTSRQGGVAGTTEVAVPVAGAEEPMAIVWIAYETDRLRQQRRP
jgi:hypothetical protein